MSNKINNITTDTAIISIDKDGIIIVDMKEGVVLDEIDVLNNSLALHRMCGSEPTLRLVDLRADWKITSKGKKATEMHNRKTKVIARAIVVNSIIKSALFSFLSKLNTKQTPQKFFTDIDEAKEWLLSFRKD